MPVSNWIRIAVVAGVGALLTPGIVEASKPKASRKVVRSSGTIQTHTRPGVPSKAKSAAKKAVQAAKRSTKRVQSSFR